MKAPEIAIIGAGPAGASAALRLASLGHAVTIFESRAFPRTKVCGEFISPAATTILEELLPPAELLAAGARRCHRFVLEHSGRERRFDLPSPAWAISRGALDSLLLDRARALGARILQPASVTGIEYGVAGVRLRLASGETHPADLVIHADGSGRHDPPGPIPHAPNLVALKCHLRGADSIDGVRIRAAPGAYVGTMQVEHGLATCALVARASLVREHSGDADSLLQLLWPEFQPRWRHGEWHACPVARSGYVEPGHPRSIRLGNAAAAVDPVGGEGIGLALWSALALAQEVQLAGGLDLSRLHRVRLRLARRYRARLRVRRWACRAAAEAVMRPGLISSLWPFLAIPAISIGPIYRLTGKPAA